MMMFCNRKIKNPILQILFGGFGLLIAALALVLVTGLVFPLVMAVITFVLAIVIIVMLILTVLFAILGSVGSIVGVLLLPFFFIGRIIGNLFRKTESKEDEVITVESHDDKIK